MKKKTKTVVQFLCDEGIARRKEIDLDKYQVRTRSTKREFSDNGYDHVLILKKNGDLSKQKGPSFETFEDAWRWGVHYLEECIQADKQKLKDLKKQQKQNERKENKQ